MTITTEISVRNFEFWSGAVYHRNVLTDEQCDQIEAMLEECCEQPISETGLNNFFWFEEDKIASWLGFDSFEELEQHNKELEEEEETCPF